MGKIVRYEFIGNPMLFWFLCITVVGIPMAVLYLIGGIVGIEERVDNPGAFLDEYRSGKFKR